MNILLVEDDSVDRLSTTRLLAQSEPLVNIVEASNAEEGIKLSLEMVFDLILMDYSLPGMNGLEALKVMRRNKNNSTAVIILSHNDDDYLSVKCIEAGAQDYLKKGEVSESRLMRAILLAKERYKIESQLRESHDKLRELAECDSLTGLANRYMFDIAIKKAIPLAKRQNKGLALLILDLDNFKNINDTLGHQAGDSLLREVALRLRMPVREEDLLCRLGGDEFSILINGLDNAIDIQQLIDRIFEALSVPFLLEGKQFIISTSIGIATYPQCADEAGQLMKCADVAMYRSKKSGRNQAHFYSEAIHKEVHKRVNLERALYSAIEKNELVLYYQPQIDFSNGGIAGVEVLLRWVHPDKGLISPLEFIPIAEEIGVINAIGAWVIEQACQQFELWRSNPAFDTEGLMLAINLSATQLSQPDFLQNLKSTLKKYNIPPQALELELTESALNRTDEASNLLYDIDSLGVKLALDDFGTGYSSISRLQEYPFKVLKIDKSFVQTIDENDEANFLRAISSFAKTLQLEVVAEGVETEEQKTWCQQLGLNRIQGFYYAKPMSAKALENTWLNKEKCMEHVYNVPVRSPSMALSSHLEHSLL